MQVAGVVRGVMLGAVKNRANTWRCAAESTGCIAWSLFTKRLSPEEAEEIMRRGSHLNLKSYAEITQRGELRVFLDRTNEDITNKILLSQDFAESEDLKLTYGSERKYE